MAHIELDDMGELWSIGALGVGEQQRQSQLDIALDTIHRAQGLAKGEREVVVITFVHGWHNNASEYDEKNKDLGSFKTTLQDLSSRYSRDFPDHPPILVGVFISWRGQSIRGDLLASYWNRRDAAVRVGGVSLTETITRLMFATKGVPLAPGPNDRCEEDAINETSHFVVIGHSFGARALEHAITQPMLSLILERQSQAQECIAQWNHMYPDHPLSGVSFVAPADLVVFLNAADDAIEMKSMIEALKRSDLKVAATSARGALGDNAGGPFLISITSDGDWATELVMPVAQWFSMSGLAFRKYDSDACAEGQLCGHRQSYFYRHSAASIKEMRSHTVRDQDPQSDQCKEAETTDDDWPYFVATVKGTQRCFSIDEALSAHVGKDGRSYPAWNTTPAFVIGVPKTLIPSHTDVFQDGTEELLITISNHFNQAFTNTTRIRTSAKVAPAVH